MGFTFPDSMANFLFVTHERVPAREILKRSSGSGFLSAILTSPGWTTACTDHHRDGRGDGGALRVFGKLFKNGLTGLSPAGREWQVCEMEEKYRMEALSAAIVKYRHPSFRAGCFLCLLGPKLLRFFMPFVIGWIIALIANPPVLFFERRLKLVRKHSSILIVVLVLAMVIGLLYLLITRAVMGIRELVRVLPQLYASMEGGT